MDPPVSDVRFWIKGGQLDPPVSDVTFFDQSGFMVFFMVFGWFPWFFNVVSWFFMVFGWSPWFLKLSSWIFIVTNGPRLVKSELSAPGAKWDIKNTKKVLTSSVSWPHDPAIPLAGRRPALA